MDISNKFLPIEILLRIYEFLDIKNLAKIRLCCTDMMKIADNPNLWKTRLIDKYGDHLVQNISDNLNYKILYIENFIESLINDGSYKLNAYQFFVKQQMLEMSYIRLKAKYKMGLIARRWNMLTQ